MSLTEADIQKLVLETAAQSPAQKRKVGAVLVSPEGDVISTGFNFNPRHTKCEDADGITLPEVIHAEVACVQNYWKELNTIDLTGCIMYVSHPPCMDCAAKIKDEGIEHVIVVEAFMKFDGDKTRYDLLPPSAPQAIAEVLTFGARKYKPNNWRSADDPGRYLAALERHIQAYKSGEIYDGGSGLHHLAHAMCNATFLIEMDFQPVALGKAKIRAS